MGELGYPSTAEDLARRMAAILPREDFATLVAEADGEVAGLICVTVVPSLYRTDPPGAITALVVSSAFRGRGVARLLIDAGERWLRDRGVRYATVNPSTHRTDAHHLYTRLGYAATGTRFSKALG